MESLFESVENLGAWDSYIRTFQTIGVTDEKLSLAMTDAMFTSNWDVLYNLISRTRSGRRVFKQLCLKGTVPFLAHLDLEARQESDLAFNVIVGQNMWNFVLEFYHHSDVTQRSRRQAFWRAVRQQAWDYVTKMAASDVTWERDRRAAFLAAVRQEQFRWAVQLCNQRVAVTDGDLRFAIKTCFATGHCDVAIEFLPCCQSDETRLLKILKCVLKQAVHSGIVVQVGHQTFSNFGIMIGTNVIEMSCQPNHNRTETGHPELELTSATDFFRSRGLHSAEHGYVNAFIDQVRTMEDNANTDDIECFSKYVIRQAINSDNAECFRALCGQHIDNEKLVRYAFEKALKGDRSHFIIKTIDESFCGTFLHRRLLLLAVQLAVKAENWDFVRDIVIADNHQLCIDWLDCLICKTSNLKTLKNWQYITPILELLIKTCDDKYELSVRRWGAKNQIPIRKVKRFTKWCKENAFSHVSVHLSLETKDWSFVKETMDAMDSPMSQGLLEFVLDESVDNQAWDVTVACLKQASPDDLDQGYDIFWNGDAMSLIDKCRSEGMKDWVVRLAVWTDQWQIVETEMDSSDDEALRNFVLRESAENGSQWQIVYKLLTKCSGSESCLRDVLRAAVEMGQCQCAKTLMNMINPISDNARFLPIMYLAVKSDNPQEMISVCIAAGVSTHYPADDRFCSPMKIALYSPFNDDDELFSVIKALFESGACSHKELRRLQNDSHIQGSLKRRSQLTVLQYMEEAANRPRSLQNLCRLTVSHRIGCQSGREDRVLSLPLPPLFKDYIMFSDLTSKD